MPKNREAIRRGDGMAKCDDIEDIKIAEENPTL
jgi:hypothetical protein